MTLYELLLFVHVLMAAIWVGGALTANLLAEKASKTSDPVLFGQAVDNAAFVGKRVIAPSSGILFLAAIGLVLKGEWGFTTPWVLIGIVLYALSVAAGAGFLGPQSVKLSELVKSKGMDDPEVTSLSDRVKLVARLDFLVLVLVILDMTVKPGS